MFIQTTPGMTTTVPWWAQLHKDGARNSAADEFKFLEWHTPDHYYQLNRPAFGAVGAQITLAGFSTNADTSTASTTEHAVSIKLCRHFV